MNIILYKILALTTFFLTNYASDVDPTLQEQGKVDNKGFIALKFKKKYGQTYGSATSHYQPGVLLQKRDNGFEIVEITNEQSFYSVELDIGTPSQEVTVLVDTGSSDLWVMGSNNPYCSRSRNSQIASEDLIDCEEFGTFNIDQSSTWSKNDSAPPFFISYGDSTFASGIWGQDRLHLEDLNITGLSFAVANRTNSTVGVLGLGLPGLETTNSGRNGYQYDNFPLVLQRAGATKSSSYSLFLNSLQEEHGSVLFGAVDHSKYTGSLYTIPLINTLQRYGYSQPIQFEVTLQGIGLSGDDTESNTTLTTTKIPALLDSGTTLTYLPQSILDNLADRIGATFAARYGYYVVPCNPAGDSSSAFDDDTNLVFDFGGFHIDTPLNDYLISVSRNTCILGLIPQDSNSAILGDTFLTHAYVVYDLENLEISMAQARYINDYDAEDHNDDDIELINSTGGVPGATRAAGYSNTWSTSVSRVSTGGDIFTLHPHATQIASQFSFDGSSSSPSGTNGGSARTTTTRATSRQTTSSSSNTNTARRNAAAPAMNRHSDILQTLFLGLAVMIPFDLF